MFDSLKKKSFTSVAFEVVSEFSHISSFESQQLPLSFDAFLNQDDRWCDVRGIATASSVSSSSLLPIFPIILVDDSFNSQLAFSENLNFFLLP